MFVAVREIRKKRDDTNLVEGPDGYVNITEQKVKIITENFGNILKQDSVTVYLMSITEIKNTLQRYSLPSRYWKTTKALDVTLVKHND